MFYFQRLIEAINFGGKRYVTDKFELKAII